MTFDLVNIPSTIDMLHLGLMALVALFFILFLVANRQRPRHSDIQTPAMPESAKATTAAPKPVALKESSPDAAFAIIGITATRCALY